MSLETPFADRVTAIVLAGLGLATLVGGFQMDRLEIRQIHPASIPGLVPMILGALLVVCAVLLYRSTIGKRAPDTLNDDPSVGPSVKRLVFTAILCTFFALVLVGRMPFFVSSALFISTFSAVFLWQSNQPPMVQARGVALSIVIGVAAAGAISLLFRYGFLVRLP